MPFTPDELDLMRQTREVHIETRAGDRTYRTIIWIVVEEDEVYVRSVRGPSGRWFQRAIVDPEVAVVIGDMRVEARAKTADDPASIAAASAGLSKKYPKSRSLDAMLAPHTLPTTMRLVPVE